MQIQTFPEADTPAPLRAQVLALQDEAWPRDVPSSGTSHDPALRPVSMLLVDGPTVLAALDILTKEIEHAGHRLRAGGLSTVVTRRAARGQGHGRTLVTAAREHMARGGTYDIGLFTCDRPLRAFYEAAGWQELPGTVLVGGTDDDPFPSDRPGFDKVTMGAFFTPAGRAARSAFAHTRIALHPGGIDKLW
ncbi:MULTISPECIES: GNAT family N-acetyltransferase [unclassified Streptomyces]|uniref:GNAT family N-acetyltransferase n=1 Tax=unclassified Streptomyces TaxID=2593676 RepID=UPI00381BDE40